MGKNVYTGRIQENRKIEIPPPVRDIVTHDPESEETLLNTVCWNIHADRRIIALSNVPLHSLMTRELDDEGLQKYEFVDRTKITDGGRYIRPPNSLPDHLLQEFERKEVKNIDLVNEQFDFSERWQQAETIEEQDAIAREITENAEEIQERLEQTVTNEARYVLYDDYLRGHINVVLLVTRDQFTERMPPNPSIFLDFSLDTAITTKEDFETWVLEEAKRIREESDGSTSVSP